MNSNGLKRYVLLAKMNTERFHGQFIDEQLGVNRTKGTEYEVYQLLTTID
ncbi:hypothetical protein OAF42_00980 [Planctomicrobium sp.]|nr:hypothetical protein [Planctomicrobium sp.]MDA7528175.1 hypothetical protein [bacterium]MDB4732992.1 hypothetical protein [Planctomicrobium sp.]